MPSATPSGPDEITDTGQAPASSPPTGRKYLRLIALGAAIGIPAALVAAGFMALVGQLEHLLWETLPHALGRTSPPFYLVVGLPVVGALVVLLARWLLPGDGGHDPLDGLSGAPTPAEYGPGVALAALGSLSFGAVLGPEAPLIALGSVVGMSVSRFVELGPQEKAVLATAGSFAAIAALFGGPIVAGVLLVEAGVAMGASLIPMLVPGLVASAIGYVIFEGLGDWGGLNTVALAVPGLPAYNGTRVLDLLVGVAVGVLAALLIAAVRHLGTRVSRLGSDGKRMAGLLIGGAIAVGLLAVTADALGASSQDVLFSGQDSVATLVAEGSLAVVVIVLVAKALGYAVSLGCGFRGGPVFPAIFLGVGLASLAVVTLDVSPTLAIAVGTAAGMAAMTRLLFSALVFSLLLVGTHGVDAMPAAVLAASAAWVTTTALQRDRTPAPPGPEAIA
jgi:H+/Cl- antiporter ClcA